MTILTLSLTLKSYRRGIRLISIVYVYHVLYMPAYALYIYIYIL